MPPVPRQQKLQSEQSTRRWHADRKSFLSAATICPLRASFLAEMKTMAKPEISEQEVRDHLMRFRAMEAETTDPIATRFLRDIVVDLETELDQRNIPGAPQS